jgi:molecular chaperone GrpE
VEHPDSAAPPAGEGAVESPASEVSERYLRLAADFDNFRRRVARDRAEWDREIRAAMLSRALPILDDLERAQAATPDPAVADGLRLIVEAFRTWIREEGAERVPAIGQAFDPALHEAVAVVQEGEVAPGMIVDELLAGYRIGGRLIRPARVRVSGEAAAG